MAIVIADWIGFGKQLGVDFIHISKEEWVKGCDHELEHWKTVNGSPRMIAGIALDHLREDPNYYQKLARMEEHTQKAIIMPSVKPLTDDEIEGLSRVTTEDVKQIRANLVPHVRSLLDARDAKPTK